MIYMCVCVILNLVVSIIVIMFIAKIARSLCSPKDVSQKISALEK